MKIFKKLNDLDTYEEFHFECRMNQFGRLINEQWIISLRHPRYLYDLENSSNVLSIRTEIKCALFKEYRMLTLKSVDISRKDHDARKDGI